MIVSFRDKRTREFAKGKFVKAFSEAPVSLKDVAGLREYRFESLQDDYKGQYSIPINNRWRVCFEWPDGSPGPVDVEIVDYH